MMITRICLKNMYITVQKKKKKKNEGEFAKIWLLFTRNMAKFLSEKNVIF